MITVDNKDKDCFILTPSLLRVGDTGEKFGKIRSINVKKDSLGNPFLQLVVSGKDGQPIMARLFGDSVGKYAVELEKYSNQIVLLSYVVTSVFDKLSLTLDWFVKPDEEKLRGISIDLFESVISNIDTYINRLKSFVEAIPTVFTDFIKNIMQSQGFTSLLYHSDPEVLDGKNGYMYVFLNMSWGRIIELVKLGVVRKSTAGLLFTTQLMVEIVLSKHNINNASYTFDVFKDLISMMNDINVGTSIEINELKDLVTDYANLRLGIKSNTSSLSSQILYNEFSSLYSTFRYIGQFDGLIGTVNIDGRYIKK